MRINSSTIGMESARSYRASNVSTKRLMMTKYQQSFSQNSALLGTLVSDGQQQKGESAKETSGKTASFGEWQDRFGVSKNRISFRSREMDVSDNIRQITVRYIFDLLFSSRRNWLRDNFSGEQEAAQQDIAGQQTAQYNGFTYGQQTVQYNGFMFGQQTVQYNGFAYGQQTVQYNGFAYGQQTLQNNGFVAGPNRQNNGFAVGSNVQNVRMAEEVWQYEQEETGFSTVGTVRTSDGREIHFNVEVGMSREFEQYYSRQIQAASTKMCDPLVINLDTDVAELSDQKFYFDIDADGVTDEISRLGSGSGFLALDKNGDGVINDGSELFGTKSGDGFADLALYDEDGNGWIDENDSVWSKLKIWCKDENGKDVLYRLADKGVGAICLQKVSTDFTMRDVSGETQGAIRSTGIFLHENGTAGTVQHVDFAKKVAAYS